MCGGGTTVVGIVFHDVGQGGVGRVVGSVGSKGVVGC
jgi:hypothetical protein